MTAIGPGLFHGHHVVHRLHTMLAPRAEADRKGSNGERRGPECLVLQRLSTCVATVFSEANEVEIHRNPPAFAEIL